MRRFSRTSLIGWAILIVAAGLALELLLDWKQFMPIAAGCFLLYLGKKKGENDSGKTYFIIGIVLIVVSIVSTFFFSLLAIVIVAFWLYQYSLTKKEAQKIVVEIVPPGQKSSIIRKKPLIKNKFSGRQRIVNEVFEWDDVNIQCGFGDTTIDLGMTMLPPGESVIVIRSFVGNIQLLVPFDADIHINHSAIIGKMSVFGHEEELLNANVIYHSPQNEETASRKVKIITNVLFGDVEVRRI